MMISMLFWLVMDRNKDLSSYKNAATFKDMCQCCHTAAVGWGGLIETQ